MAFDVLILFVLISRLRKNSLIGFRISFRTSLNLAKVCLKVFAIYIRLGTAMFLRPLKLGKIGQTSRILLPLGISQLVQAGNDYLLSRQPAHEHR